MRFFLQHNEMWMKQAIRLFLLEQDLKLLNSIIENNMSKMLNIYTIFKSGPNALTVEIMVIGVRNVPKKKLIDLPTKNLLLLNKSSGSILDVMILGVELLKPI